MALSLKLPIKDFFFNTVHNLITFSMVFTNKKCQIMTFDYNKSGPISMRAIIVHRMPLPSRKIILKQKNMFDLLNIRKLISYVVLVRHIFPYQEPTLFSEATYPPQREKRIWAQTPPPKKRRK